MIEGALFLKPRGYRPTTRCRTEGDPPPPVDVARDCNSTTPASTLSREKRFTSRKLRDRKMQRVLMQFFKPEKYFVVQGRMLKAGRNPRPYGKRKTPSRDSRGEAGD
jgi:hypothetical protein